VLEDGDDETQAIAALLHGTAEDGGGRPLLARIRGECGDDVAEIVAAARNASIGMTRAASATARPAISSTFARSATWRSVRGPGR
jgi:(p)ppGpp synthase/HD superfamily hydrolase